MEVDATIKNVIPAEEIVGDGGWGDTANDVRDMQRLGKKQEFKVMNNRHHMRMADEKYSETLASWLPSVSYPSTWLPGSLF